MSTFTTLKMIIFIIIIMFFMKACISITNSGYDQARTKQDGRVFTDVLDAPIKADANIDTTGEDIGTAVRGATQGR
jgi:hypothetical protein